MKTEILASVGISDEAFAKLLPTYFEEIESDLSEMKTFLLKKNFTKIKAIAHKIKGSSSNYGALLVLQKATEIEDNINKNELAALEANLTLLNNLIETTKIEAKRKFGI